MPSWRNGLWKPNRLQKSGWWCLQKIKLVIRKEVRGSFKIKGSFHWNELGFQRNKRASGESGEDSSGGTTEKLGRLIVEWEWDSWGGSRLVSGVQGCWKWRQKRQTSKLLLLVLLLDSIPKFCHWVRNLLVSWSISLDLLPYSYDGIILPNNNVRQSFLFLPYLLSHFLFECISPPSPLLTLCCLFFLFFCMH